MTARLPTEQEVDLFREEGVVCLRQALGPDLPRRLGDAIDAWLLAPTSAIERVESKDGSGGALLVSMFLWKSSPTFASIVLGADLAAIAGALLGEPVAGVFNDNLFVKEPFCHVRVPWHQDVPYYPVTGTNFVSLWITADPVSLETGGVEYVVASHTWGREFRPTHFSLGKGDYDVALPPVPDIDARRSDLEIASWELEPGDCVAHHGLTLHSSGPNLSRSVRRALAVRFFGAGLISMARGDVIRLPDDHPLHH